MFSERGGLQECVLAQVNTVPGRADESGREQLRAEHAPICAPISKYARAHASVPRLQQATPACPSLDSGAPDQPADQSGPEATAVMGTELADRDHQPVHGGKAKGSWF